MTEQNFGLGKEFLETPKAQIIKKKYLLNWGSSKVKYLKIVYLI